MKVKVDRNVLYGSKLYHSGETIEISESEQEAWKHFGKLIEEPKAAVELMAKVQLPTGENSPKKPTKRKTAAKKS